MNKIDIAKKIAKIVVGTSVGFTVSGALRSNTPVTKAHHKAEAYVGALVLGMMVAEKAEDYTDKKIDELVEWYKTTFSKTPAE